MEWNIYSFILRRIFFWIFRRLLTAALNWNPSPTAPSSNKPFVRVMLLSFSYNFPTQIKKKNYKFNFNK